MKKHGLAILMAVIMVFALTGCGNKSLLSAKEPVELTMWHVYGEQAGSPMDTLVEEFNRTEGKEKGVRVKVTEMSSAAKIGGFLLETQGDSAQEMPDLFTCHIGDAIALGEDNLLDWNDWFTEKEQSEFVSGFLADGEADDGKLLVFPLSKSTQLLMLNGTGFARFSAATGVTYDDLSTWEGFYDAAGRFYDWTNGTEPFCAMDYPIRAVELNALEHGAEDFYTEDGWYDFDNAVFKESWMQFARALAQGHIPAVKLAEEKPQGGQGDQQSGGDEHHLGLKGIGPEVVLVPDQILPDKEADAAHDNQRHGGEIDQRVADIAGQGRKGGASAHQVKARVAKGGDGVEHTVPDAPQRAVPGNKSDGEETGSRTLDDQRRAQDKAEQSDDAAQLRRTHGLLKEKPAS